MNVDANSNDSIHRIDDDLHDRTTPKRARGRGPVLCTLAIAAVGLGSVAALQATSAEAEEGYSRAEWRQIVAAPFTEPSKPIPDQMLESPMGIELESAVYHGSSEAASYWTSFHEDGRLCLIVVLDQPALEAGSSCAAPDDFVSRGIPFQMGTSSEAVRAYLLPDAIVDDASRYGTLVTDNVLERDPFQSDSAAITVPTSESRATRSQTDEGSASEFVLLPLEAADEIAEQ